MVGLRVVGFEDNCEPALRQRPGLYWTSGARACNNALLHPYFTGRHGQVRLKVDDITADDKRLSFSEPETEINHILAQGRLKEYRLEKPVSVTVSYYRAGTELVFEGELFARGKALCARCAEEFSSANERPFRFVLAPRALGWHEEGDLDAEDLEFSLYDGDEVDLTPLIREQLFLALPTRPLCREDCRGLCPRCGANLNVRECGCRSEGAEARLAVLRSLKVERA